MDILRADPTRFAGLPGWNHEPNLVDCGDGVRAAVVDAGPRDATPILLMHGEPTWGYLYRDVAAVLLARGLRVVIPDLVGFGRSDKPAQRTDYTYARHVEWMRTALFERIDLSGCVLVGQDWGGLIGLRLLAEHGDRFAAAVAANTGLPTGDQPLGEAFSAWRRFSQEVPELPVGTIVAGGCRRPPPPEVVAAYEAPFPDEAHKEGARQFPLLVPASPDDPAAAANRAAWQVLAGFQRPFLCAFSDGDPITKGGDRPMRELIPGARHNRHVTIAGAGHFLQEDAGEELGEVVARFVLDPPRPG